MASFVFFWTGASSFDFGGGMSRRDGRGDQANEGGGHPVGFSHGTAGDPRFAPQQHQHPSRTPASVYGSGYSGAGDPYGGAQQVPGQQHGGTRPGYPQHGQSVQGGAGMPRQPTQPVSASPTLSARHAPCAQSQFHFDLVCRTLPLLRSNLMCFCRVWGCGCVRGWLGVGAGVLCAGARARSRPARVLWCGPHGAVGGHEKVGRPDS